MKWSGMEAEIIRLRYLLAAKTIENEQLRSALREESSALKPLSTNTLQMPFKSDARSTAKTEERIGDEIGGRLTNSDSGLNQFGACVEFNGVVTPSIASRRTVSSDHEVENSVSSEQAFAVDLPESFGEYESVESLTENRLLSRPPPVDNLGAILDPSVTVSSDVGISRPTNGRSPQGMRREREQEKGKAEAASHGKEKEITMESIHEGIINLTANIRRLGISTEVESTETNKVKSKDYSSSERSDTKKQKSSLSNHKKHKRAMKKHIDAKEFTV